MLRVRPVAVLLTVTVAPGTTAPDGSVTTPTSDPNVVWAFAVTRPATAKSRRSTKIVMFLERKLSRTLAQACLDMEGPPVFLDLLLMDFGSSPELLFNR